MSYLIFASEGEALSRSEQAGVDKGLAYHKGVPDGTRYVWGVHVEQAETNPRAALYIDGYETALLTSTETTALVNELPVDWQGYTDDQE